MAIGAGALLEISNVGRAFDMEMRNVWTYEVGAMPVGTTAVQIGEAWWNHVKTTLRAVPTSPYTALFQTVLVRELNDPAGDYGTYAVPPAEQAGTRSPGSAAEPLPPFNAVALRLTVGTRLTRPGQKRFPGLVESDQSSGAVAVAVTNALNALGAVVSTSMTLGAPAATGILIPVICKRDATGFVTDHQQVTGYLASSYVTSQNTRKIGRGS